MQSVRALCGRLALWVILCLAVSVGFRTNFVRVGASAPNPDEGGTNEVCALALDLGKGLTPPHATGVYAPLGALGLL